MMELEATWGRAFRVWWAYLWRSLLAVLAVVVVGALCGAVIGFVSVMIGMPRQAVQLVTAVFGLVIGVSVSIVPIKMILNKKFGDFRLALISTRS